MSAAAVAAGATGFPATVARDRSIPASAWTDIAFLVILTAIASAGFQTVFGAGAYTLAAGGGILVGGGCAVVARLLRFPLIATAALGVAAFVLLGTAFAIPAEGLYGVVPTLESILDLGRGAIFGWSDAVTLHAPLQAPPYLGVIPFAATWLTSLVGASIAVRMRPAGPHTVARVATMAAGPAAILVATVLLGTKDPVFATARGAGFAVIGLVWVGWRVRTACPSVPGGSRRAWRTVGSAAALLAGALVVGVVGGTFVAPPATSRVVLRDSVQPPFDPLQYPAPLAGFRQYTRELKDTKLFTIDGIRQGQYVRLVTMDSYDGVVWSVTDAKGTGSSGGFRLYGGDIPLSALNSSVSRSSATVTVDGYSDVWLPTPGYATGLGFAGSEADALAQSTRVDTSGGSAAVMQRLRRGDSYSIDVATLKVPSDTALQDVAVATVPIASVTNIPDAIGAKAEEYAGKAPTAIERLRNVERSLKRLGYLSHGLASDPVPSSAGESAARMTDLLTASPMVGDQEQYATAFALMARHLGYASRVVLGFKPEVKDGSSSATVTGDQVTAWVEVPFEGVGWVPFFPTPDKTDTPVEKSVKPKIEPQPQVRQPPRTVPKDDDLLTPVKMKNESAKKKKDNDVGFTVPVWAYYAGGVVLALAIAYFLPLMIIVAVKRRRRRRRSRGPGDQSAAGAWSELVDRYTELGLKPPSTATRLQTAQMFGGQAAQRKLGLSGDAIESLAAEIDAAVFGGETVSQESASELWSSVDRNVGTTLSGLTWLQRRVAAFRIAPRPRRAARRPRSV
ncbi:transglutaminase domain-containing protein [Planctomonas sp. JC2975]|uniref:transglutaminase-like domain-containing protein n=1 Tax=Planctomonas sp. JC2975 TaxID=2729626 RepID=UPI001475506D|nr:transglutaminase-like domain-containing protein [Planctomonas sp. JC2975]NNC11007.1 transglutaminase domain-containing protein [Planctomonas sp. JC2975]